MSTFLLSLLSHRLLLSFSTVFLLLSSAIVNIQFITTAMTAEFHIHSTDNLMNIKGAQTHRWPLRLIAAIVCFFYYYILVCAKYNDKWTLTFVSIFFAIFVCADFAEIKLHFRCEPFRFRLKNTFFLRLIHNQFWLNWRHWYELNVDIEQTFQTNFSLISISQFRLYLWTTTFYSNIWNETTKSHQIHFNWCHFAGNSICLWKREKTCSANDLKFKKNETFSAFAVSSSMIRFTA